MSFGNFNPATEKMHVSSVQLLHPMAAQAALGPLGLVLMLQAEAEQRRAAAKGDSLTAKRQQLQRRAAGTTDTSQDVAKQRNASQKLHEP